MEYPDISEPKTNASWINYKIMEDTWFSGDDEIVFEDVLFHPKSLLTGWLKIAPGFYDFHVDPQFGIVSPRPNADMDYKRAYQVALFIKETGTVTWTVSNVGGRKSFENAYHLFNKEINNNDGKVAYLKKLKSIKIDTQQGFSREVQWDFKGWVNPPEDFVLETETESNGFDSNPIPPVEDDNLPF